MREYHIRHIASFNLVSQCLESALHYPKNVQKKHEDESQTDFTVFVFFYVDWYMLSVIKLILTFITGNMI